MKDIKTKDFIEKRIKKLDKTITWTERIKDPIVYISKKANTINDSTSISEYGDDKIKYYSNRLKDESIHIANKSVTKSKDTAIKGYKKYTSHKNNSIKEVGKEIKDKSDKLVKETKKVAKNVPKDVERAKKLVVTSKKIAEQSVKATEKILEVTTKVLISSIKAFINAMSSLIALLGSGGAIVLIIVVVICLIGLLCASMFGIFFSNDANSVSMSEVIKQVNSEIHTKVTNELIFRRITDYEINPSSNNWKEVIAIYSVKYSSSSDSVEPILYLNESNISKIKQIYWNMNTITYVTKYVDETVTISNPRGPDTTITRKKPILEINMTSKSLDDIMNMYHFNEKQKEQVRELTSTKYDTLWRNLLYGNNSGEFVYWRQHDPQWGHIKIGNTNATIDDIGCLVTSIAILIEKSGANNTIIPFNPGSFVEALNKNNGFDEDGNLYYGAINRIIPNFEYVDMVNLSGKNKQEKLSLINEYYLQGYYLSVEVKGDTGQHWVAVLDVNDTNITMVDPGTDNTDMWNTYKWENTSQFRYFKKN